MTFGRFVLLSFVFLVLPSCRGADVLLVSRVLLKDVAETGVDDLKEKMGKDANIQFLSDSAVTMMINRRTKSCFGIHTVAGAVIACAKGDGIFVFSGYRYFDPNAKFDVNAFRKYKKSPFESEALVIHDKVVENILKKPGSKLTEFLIERSEISGILGTIQ